MSLHYLVKSRCSKFLPNYTVFISIRLLRFDVKVKTAYVATTFLLRGHCQTCEGCPETIFYVSTGWYPACMLMRHAACMAHQHATPSLSWSEREMRETRRRLSACVCVRGAQCEHEF